MCCGIRWTARLVGFLGAVAFALGVSALAWQTREWKSGVDWAKPEVVTPGEGTAPPSDAIVLFDGKDLSAWKGAEKWKVRDGFAIVGGTAQTRQAFGDCQLHLEFASPPKVSGEGQGRGNSGVYFMGHYELQILDSYENETYYDGQCGAIYKQSPPLVNASRPPGEWQSYDVVFTAPRFREDGALDSPARMTVFHNGVLIQNNFELQGSTFFHQPPAYEPHAARAPLSLQYHRNPVRFRNIWIRELTPRETPAVKAVEDAAAT